jgi:NAD(P)-dependent dehydrogenase (short-subunit alcohol dehydrogenase family)
MINHTMIVSFDQPVPDAELDQYLADIERVMLDTGLVQSVVTRRHIPIPGEEAIPALIATAIVQVTLADTDALAKAFAAPGIGEVIDRATALEFACGGTAGAVLDIETVAADHNRQLDQTTLDEFERVVRVNLAGTFLCMKYELPLLKLNGGGAIVNVASDAACDVTGIAMSVDGGRRA